jgi:hypothetical protein
MANDWARYLPNKQRLERERMRRRLRRRTWLSQQRVRVGLCLMAYGIWCLVLLGQGLWAAFGLALVPLIVLPGLVALVWWLLWQEFNG